MMYRPLKNVAHICKHATAIRQKLARQCPLRGGTRSYLAAGSFPLLLLFRQHHPQGKETHDHPVSEVAEHHGEQEGECDDGVGSCQGGKNPSMCYLFTPAELKVEFMERGRERGLTWAYLAVVSHPVGLHDALESRGELVGFQQGGWGVGAGDAVHKGRDGGIAFSLETKRDYSEIWSVSTEKECGFLISTVRGKCFWYSQTFSDHKVSEIQSEDTNKLFEAERRN